MDRGGGVTIERGGRQGGRGGTRDPPAAQLDHLGVDRGVLGSAPDPPPVAGSAPGPP